MNKGRQRILWITRGISIVHSNGNGNKFMKTIRTNNIYTTLICVLFSFCTYAQNENFRNLASCMLQYEKCMPFNNGVAPVLYRGRWGLIDTCGNEVFPCVLDFRIVQNYANGVFIGKRAYEGFRENWARYWNIYATNCTHFIDKQGNVYTENICDTTKLLKSYNFKIHYNRITKIIHTRKGLRGTKGVPIKNEQSNYYWIIKGRTMYPTPSGYFCELRDENFKKVGWENCIGVENESRKSKCTDYMYVVYENKKHERFQETDIRYLYEVDEDSKQSSFGGDWAYIRELYACHGHNNQSYYVNVRAKVLIAPGFVKYSNGGMDSCSGEKKPKTIWTKEDCIIQDSLCKDDLKDIARVCDLEFFLQGKKYIEIPESVTLIDGENWKETESLEKIVVYWNEPKNTEAPASWKHKNIILEVPKGTKEKYMNVKPWADFIIVEREK